MDTTAPPAAAVARTKTGWSSTRRLRAALEASSWDARWTAVAVLAFLAVTVWWLTQDTRVSDFYSAGQARFDGQSYVGASRSTQGVGNQHGSAGDYGRRGRD